MTANPTVAPRARAAVSIKTAAEMYDVSPATIRAAILSGHIAAKKIGANWSIPLAALTRWYDSLPAA